MPIDLSYVSEMVATDRLQRRYSSLDLCAHDAFTVLIGSHDHSCEPALDKRDFGGIPVNVCMLGRDFCVMDGAHGEAWLDATGFERGMVLVIRPD